MKTAIFQYKCRLCREIFSGEHTSTNNAQHYLIHAVYGFALGDALSAFNPPSLISTHPACTKGYGVADLIGYIVRGEDD
jgi:hypothetical protein